MNPPSSYSLTVRFPSGTEFWHSDTLPGVGSTVSQFGRDYLVVSCEQAPDGAFALNVAEQKTNDSVESAFA